MKRNTGFTIVELLIVIVIIGILAGLVISTFANSQKQARDATRRTDINSIVKALELYYADKGVYPAGSGSTTINSGWSTTADASWETLRTKLAPYSRNLPRDPISTPGPPGGNVTSSNTGIYNYAYFSNSGSGVTYCGAEQYQMYILVYRLEGDRQDQTLRGDCPNDPAPRQPLGPYSTSVNSNYRHRAQ